MSRDEPLQPVPIGYFPKRHCPRPADYVLPGVEEIASVSTCIAHGPEVWLELWRHNELQCYPSPAEAHAVAAMDPDPSGFMIYAWRLWPECWVAGARLALALPPLSVEPVPASFKKLGYDAVSSYQGLPTGGFECSPLSCNGLAAIIPTNRYCLLDTVEAAMAAAERFSIGGAEPGTYYVLEVLRREAGG